MYVIYTFGITWFLIFHGSLREVGTVNTEATILGFKCSLPIMVSPAAMAGLGHPEGEKNITRAAGKEGLIQGVSDAVTCLGLELIIILDLFKRVMHTRRDRRGKDRRQTTVNLPGRPHLLGVHQH